MTTLIEEAYAALGYRGVMEATVLVLDIPSILAKIKDGVDLTDEDRYYLATYVEAVEPALTRITSAVEALAEAATGIPTNYSTYRVNMLPEIMVEMEIAKWQ